MSSPREASNLYTALNNIFNRHEIYCTHRGDDELQGRIYVDDVIMSPNCKSAYIHVSAVGSKLEVRQAIVWLVRNQPMLRTALARRYAHRSGIPKLYFVESKFREWERQLEKARQIPELNLPDPLARVREKLSFEYRLKKMGMGNPDKPIRKYGYGKAF